MRNTCYMKLSWSQVSDCPVQTKVLHINVFISGCQKDQNRSVSSQTAAAKIKVQRMGWNEELIFKIREDWTLMDLLKLGPKIQKKGKKEVKITV